jgi:prophage antirepressor-like protein
MNDTNLSIPKTEQANPLVFPTTGQPVRMIIIDGEPWWVAADVCEVLGYNHTPSAVRRLEDDDYRLAEFSQVSPNVRQPDGQPPHRPMTVVNEPGLYSLILWSEKQQAKDFKRWVTHEVLPTLRKTGRYETPTPVAVLTPLQQARAREKLDYRQLLDMITDNAPDYNKTDRNNTHYFSEFQNKLYRDITGFTASQIKHMRPIQTWSYGKRGKPVQKDYDTAKNYLYEAELRRLNRLVRDIATRASDFSEDGVHITMELWISVIDSEINIAGKRRLAVTP